MARTKSSTVWRSALLDRRKITVFVVCLGVSALLWLLMAFNGFYSTHIRVPIRYLNMPEDNLLMSHLPKEAEIEVSGSGYHLLSYRLQPHKAEILLDGRNMGSTPVGGTGKSFLTTHHGIDYFNRLHGDIKALNISPDTIFFNFFRRGYAKVPVQVSSYLEFAGQYNLVDSLRISPDSITLTGPVELTGQFQKVETEPLILTQLSKSGTYNLKIKQPHPELSFEPFTVSVHLEIDRYTEASLKVPIFLEHLISRDSLQVFPQMAEIVFQVALRNYNKIKPSDFTLAADINELKQQKGGKIKLHLRKIPFYARQSKIKPEFIECVVKKNPQ